MSQFLRKLGWLPRRARKEAELREELEFHLQAEADEKIASGLPKKQAEYTARREFGNLTLVEEDVRAAWGWTIVEQIGQDLRYAARAMASNRTFTALVVVSLALGIGVNTALYSFVESILLRSLPVPEPESLVVMKWRAQGIPSVASTGFSTSTGGPYSDPKGGMIGSAFPYASLALFENNNDILARAFCYIVVPQLNITLRGETEALGGQYVSGNYFPGMGVPPAAGRLIVRGDDETGAAPVAVLSYRYSQRRFGQAGNAVGQLIRINDTPFTVVGVAPPEFFGADPGSVPDVWLPLHANLLLERSLIFESVAQQYLDQNFYWIEILGRLKPGISLAQAQAVLGPQFRQFAENSAANERERADIPRLIVLEGAAGLDSLRRRYSNPLYMLMAMAGLILLIACANIANMLLARAMARAREIAVRLSLGASRLRVIRQLLTESVLLGCMGGALGVIFASWGIRFLTLLLGEGRDSFTLHAELNWQVLGFALTLSVLTGLLFGLAPAIQATRMDLVSSLKRIRSGTPARWIRPALGSVSLSRILMGAQVTFSLLLLVAASLFGRTLSNLQSIDVGFHRENVLLFTINPQAVGYEGRTLNRLYSGLRERINQIPGVRSVSLSNRPLLSGSGSLAPVTVPGLAALAETGGPPKMAGLLRVGPAFFETMQIAIVSGREFGESDGTTVPLAAVVNQRFARVSGLENPIDHTIVLGSNVYKIIGVAKDALSVSLKEDFRPMVYLPLLTSAPPGQVTYQVRTAGNPLHSANIVQKLVGQIDSRLAVTDLKTQAAHIDQAISQEITLARLCTLFAALALMIACVGLYGTVAFNVARRTGEIGIRMALGAQRTGIIWLVLREVFALAVVGLVIGVPVALAGSRYVESFLFGIEPNDALALTVAAVILLAAAMVAGYIPARRALRIDPMVALRHE